MVHSAKYDLLSFFDACKGEVFIDYSGLRSHSPVRIIPLLIDDATLNRIKLSAIDEPKIKFSLGDGKPSDEPLLNYCTHLLEE